MSVKKKTRRYGVLSDDDLRMLGEVRRKARTDAGDTRWAEYGEASWQAAMVVGGILSTGATDDDFAGLAAAIAAAERGDRA